MIHDKVQSVNLNDHVVWVVMAANIVTGHYVCHLGTCSSGFSTSKQCLFMWRGDSQPRAENKVLNMLGQHIVNFGRTFLIFGQS